MSFVWFLRAVMLNLQFGIDLMKRFARVAALIVAFCVLLLGTTHAWLVVHIDWNTVAEYESPDGRHVLYHMQSTSEAGHAPYDDNFVLSTAWHPFGRYWGATVMAGYCEGDTKVSWLDNNKLVIQCAGYDVKKDLHVVQHMGINIEVSGRP